MIPQHQKQSIRDKKKSKIKLKSKVRVEENREDKSCSITWVQFLNPTPLGPKKVKNNPKIKSNSKVRIERIIEN